MGHKMTKLQKFLRTANIAAVSTLFGLFSAVGNATVISSGSSNPLGFTWSYSSAAGALTGSGSLTLSGFNTSTLTMDVILNNTSLLSSNRLTSFGFGINPNATGVTFSDASDAGMVNASMSSIPSLATIEVCAFGGPNCSGGGNGGILGGGSDAFRILLSGAWGSSVDIAPIGFKYQTGSGSFEFTTSSSSGSTSGGLSSSGTSVPEPGVLALLSVGLLGQALLIRQRRRQQK
jgi:hypothetical protein